jgi:two-component system sensor histidine kinase CreC
MRNRPLDIVIGGVRKNALDYRIYITDARGVVLFDSTGRDTGRDFSRWNDVFLTLRGKYGARSTRDVEGIEASTVMYVAAPIRDGERIVGVLTVAKPVASVQAFVEASQQRILRRGALLLGASLLVGLLVALWLMYSLRKLGRYVADVEAGRKTVLPDLGKNEIGHLGRALEAMRRKLEGKQYVEELMHTLTHELKSPIAAIQGSAELLREDMPAAERAHFLDNILDQNARQRQLIDKLLALVRVEKRQVLEHPEPVPVAALLAQAADDCAARLQARGLRLEIQGTDGVVQGDALLLRQALGNLLDNAIDFAPPGGVVVLRAERRGERLVIGVLDRGPGVPGYALERAFERFYSLPRPDGGKSTGLGLPFVREVLALHRGSASLRNGPDGGAIAEIELPFTQNAH